MKTGWHKYYRVNAAEIAMGYGQEECLSLEQLEDYLEILKRVEKIIARRHDLLLDSVPIRKSKRKSKNG
jgi:hypothetical protein